MFMAKINEDALWEALGGTHPGQRDALDLGR
jgi:hypothetical protein